MSAAIDEAYEAQKRLDARKAKTISEARKRRVERVRKYHVERECRMTVYALTQALGELEYLVVEAITGLPRGKPSPLESARRVLSAFRDQRGNVTVSELVKAAGVRREFVCRVLRMHGLAAMQPGERGNWRRRRRQKEVCDYFVEYDGASLADLSSEFGVSVDFIREALATQGFSAPVTRRHHKPKMRKCLRCEKEFRSLGPGHRQCGCQKGRPALDWPQGGIG